MSREYRHISHYEKEILELGEKGRPPKNYVTREKDKISELRYILARKNAWIKSLEMENKLMRGFLSLTERK